MDTVKNLEHIDSLDFRKNKNQLTLSYLLRTAGVLIFGYLFFLVAEHLYKTDPINFKRLIEIKIQSLPAIVSIILIIIDVVVVLYLHELIHAAVFYFTHKQKPRIGIRGLIIFAAAPDKILNKNQLITNALAPFVGITLVGFFLMTLVPVNFSSWVYIPMVVNAAAAGGDFITIYWILKQPKGAKFMDIGDITNAYIQK